MSQEFKTGLVITGDATGGVRAIKATTGELDRLEGRLNKSDRNSKKLGKTLDQTGRSSRDFGRNVKSSGADIEWMTGKAKAAAGVLAGLFAGQAVAGVFAGAIHEAEQLERNLLRTGAVIKATGSAAGFTADELHQQARGLALATLQSTEGVMQAQQVMMTFRKVTGDTFTQAIELAADLATVTGGNLQGSVTQLGKALEDPVKGISALSRSGVSFTQAQKDMIKSLVEAGDIASAQKAILTELAQQYGGVARKEAEGLAGAQDTLGQSIQEAKLALAEQLELVERGTAIYNEAAGAVFYLRDNMDGVVMVGQAVAVLLGAKVAGALATKTAATVKSTLADRAATAQAAQMVIQEQQAAAMAARRAAGEQTAAVTSARIAAQRAQQAQAEAALQLRNIQLTQQQMVAERALETQRLQAQISATGRQQSLTRLAEIRKQEALMTAQATAAQRTLAAAETQTAAATRTLAIANADLARSTVVADAAMAKTVVTTRTATAAQTALAAATRVGSGAMALMGGPVGVAALAAGGLWLYAQRLEQAKDKTDEIKRATDEFRNSLHLLSATEKRVTYTRLMYEAEELKGKIADLKRVQENLANTDGGDPGARADIRREQERVNTQLIEYNAQLETANNNRRALTETHLEGLKWEQQFQPPEDDKGADDDKKTASLRDQAQKWLLEMERFNATEQQQVEHWRTDSLKQTESYHRQKLISHEQHEFAKVAIAEEAARRLKAIEDQRWAKFTGGGLGELGTLQREAQNIEGPRGQLIQGGVAKAITDQTFQGLPTMGGSLNPEFSTGFGEANRLEGKKQELLDDYDERIDRYQKFREMELENATLYDEQLAALRDKRQAEEQAADQQISQAKLAGAEATFGSMADIAKTFAGEQSGIYRAMFAAQKAFSLASVMMSSADAIGKAWASAPFPANLPAVGTTLLETGALQALVQGIAMPVGQAHDGIDSVPQSGTWNLEKGERVTGAALNRDLTQFLARENKQQGGHGGRGGDTPISVSVEVINHGRPAQAKTRVEQLAEREFIVQVVMEEAVSGLPGSPFNVFAGRHGLRPVGR